MFSAQIVDTVVGLFFVFWAFSLLCSGVNEFIASKLELRGQFLFSAIGQLLDRKAEGVKLPEIVDMRWVRGLWRLASSWLGRRFRRSRTPTPAAPAPDEPADYAASLRSGEVAQALYRNEHILQMHEPVRIDDRQPRLPSYIGSDTFARSLIDVLSEGKATFDTIQRGVALIPPGNPARRPLELLLNQADGSVDRFRVGVERWYDAHMKRVSGWYKRQAKRMLLPIAAAVVLLFNVDVLTVTSTLYRSDAVRQAVLDEASQARACPADAAGGELDCERDLVNRLVKIPLGWSLPACDDGRSGFCPGDWIDRVRSHLSQDTGPTSGQATGRVLTKLLGWSLAVGALSLGAPFWFDAMNKISSLRGSGPPPSPSTETLAAAPVLPEATAAVTPAVAVAATKKPRKPGAGKRAGRAK